MEDQSLRKAALPKPALLAVTGNKNATCGQVHDYFSGLQTIIPKQLFELTINNCSKNNAICSCLYLIKLLDLVSKVLNKFDQISDLSQNSAHFF